ncbi:MAG: KEOPS complex subunit Pcc1 [Candidatus Bathyarchaeota archaeon]|nr:KEOPS complex subunit Pcc1 [Candidatus Bathyarchaeota archaeon]
MKANAVVSLPFQSEKQLNALTEALAPEVLWQVGVRSKVMLITDQHNIVLKVEAKDAVALRAALNAYLRWITSIINVLGFLETAS